jgi:hypothetical protein
MAMISFTCNTKPSVAKKEQTLHGKKEKKITRRKKDGDMMIG